MAASRLPGKPLALIGGVPMVVQVARRAREADIGPVLVACADAEIADAVQAAGFRAILTDPALPSGSDRVHAAVRAADPDGRHDVVVNLQGDFPTIEPSVLRACLEPLADPATDIGTLVCPVADDAEAALTSVVKAACAFAPGARVAPALYFSRLPIPGATGRGATISASMRTDARHWRGSSRCPKRCWSGARSWSSCARWRPGCGSAAR